MLRSKQTSWRLPATLVAIAFTIYSPSLSGETQIHEEGAKAVEHAKIGPFKPIFVGVETCEASAEEPRPLQVRVVRIDLKEPSIRFLVTPSNGDEPMDCNARTVSQFLSEFKCQVAINGSPFAPLAKQPREPQDVLGLSLSRGDLYSPPSTDYDALLIGKDRRVWLDRGPVRKREIRDAENGICGFYALLIDGRNNGGMKDRHPRSAAGVTQDGRYLILMTLDGRQIGYSEGTSTAETAEWIRKFGAHDALNLDGGGSTALVIEGRDGDPVVLNSPSGKLQRLVANHLGVFAKPLPKGRDARPPSTRDAP
jgi:hypothetical protein